jgi:competence protein ComEA
VEPSGAPWRVLETPDSAAPTAEPATAHAIPWVALAVGVAAVAVAGAAALFALRPEPIAGVDGAGAFAAGAALTDTGTPSFAPVAASPEGEVVVDVSGAVAHPGLYRLPAGDRVGDAIAAAGGYGSSVDAALADRDLNLAAILHDGDKVRVPVRGEVPPSGNGPTTPGTRAGAGAAGGSLIDLNHASAEQLDTLPGVGPATAAKIIAAREEQPFATVDDLGARKVVGAATLEKLRALVTVGP